MKRLSLALFVALPFVGQEADLVLRGGVVWTGEGKSTAVAVRGNKIVAVGEAAGRMKARRVVDLKGRFAMPGFNDAHTHFLEGSMGLERIDLTGICTLPAIQKTIRDYATTHPNAAWITGSGWEYTCFPNYRLPTREDIDAVVADRPVFLAAYDGHTAWANSKAVRIAELATATLTRTGEIVKDAAGNPTGVLKEGAMQLVSRHVPKETREEKLAALSRGLKMAAAMGITSLQNASRGQDDVELYAALLAQGRLTVRTSLALDGGAKIDFERYDLLRKKYQSPMLAVRAIKFFLDGVIETKTAAMLEAYTGETTAGVLNLPEADYAAAVQKADAAGWQVYTHAIGDRAVRVALNEYEAAMKGNQTKGARHRIEHIEAIDPQDVPRFAKLGVLPVMQPIHAYPATVAVWEKLVGDKRKKLAFPWASIAATGASVTFSSDWPACISMDPIRGIHNAVNRMTMEGEPVGGWVPEQRVTLEQALRFYTYGGAYASFEEKIKGKLVVGQLADVVVLDKNPFAMAAKDLHQLKVAITIMDGKIVYGNN